MLPKSYISPEMVEKNNIQPQILSEFSFSFVRGDDVQLEE